MADAGSFWDKIAEGYDKGSRNKGPNYAARLERAQAVFSPEGRVLDVGCASGEITLDLAAHCGSILGIDLGGRMIEMAKAKVQERGVENAEFMAIDLMDSALPVPEGGYDAVTIYSVFHLVPDVEGFVERVHAVLKPGGHVLCETPCLGDWMWFWGLAIGAAKLLGKAPAIVHRLKADDLEAMLRDAGFEVLDRNIYNPKSGQVCMLARKAG
ncbi:class I SAM-dependent methyltransferase [Algisphaera agarilytica]|uniref:2-polyprenyl-3-methyl-5-hydroxy-6-metoxy-1, 4-benzoquinol methylase n=1 Tax=Algisphaera agarilytica TaxID=1385975 RepID=A0A7X0LKJ8_9BACT|nr:methyltransferase domain-containing protein [Algisphaera agarilytica]MBB6429033.1 2-polyprenyl-3-methyl-5-hydroxy-6-metoxy-1,4-benzoquinol methylase [Algisphaera agarilytica]